MTKISLRTVVSGKMMSVPEGLLPGKGQDSAEPGPASGQIHPLHSGLGCLMREPVWLWKYSSAMFLEGTSGKSTTDKSSPLGAFPFLSVAGSLVSRSRAWVLVLDNRGSES